MATAGDGYPVRAFCIMLYISSDTAIRRMATDLNLHRKTAVTSQDTPEGRARDKEVHNRERTWLLCFALDRSTSAQMGKPHSIREEWVYLFISANDLTE